MLLPETTEEHGDETDVGGVDGYVEADVEVTIIMVLCGVPSVSDAVYINRSVYLQLLLVLIPRKLVEKVEVVLEE